MGYILPITHYDYKQYQNRIHELEERPHYINKPYKTVFHRISPEYEEKENAATMNDDAPKKERGAFKEETFNFYYISKHQKAQLTGKGGIINEQT